MLGAFTLKQSGDQLFKTNAHRIAVKRLTRCRIRGADLSSDEGETSAMPGLSSNTICSKDFLWLYITNRDRYYRVGDRTTTHNLATA